MNKEKQELFNKITLNQDYGDVQKRFIIMGIEKGLDVSIYAKPEFHSTVTINSEKTENV